MLDEKKRIFCVHSKSRPLQAEFYNALRNALEGLDITLTRYNEWSWETPGGKSAEEIEWEERRSAR